MKTYVVGGAVRDELLGLPVQDRDHVVVGATPDDMVAAGFRPVGKDFPVFLHPETHEEYALARTERKSGHGYKGFTVYAAPDVTLEQDLERRDLTINAMARDADGAIVDPFGGQEDLKNRLLRHVGAAFVEDPVRILRVARFAARFGFGIAEETRALMKQMVDSGEADHLVAERVWQEFAKGLDEPHAERMFDVLAECGLLKRVMPELKAIPKRFAGPRPVRFAVLCWPLKEHELKSFCERFRVPNEERDLALLGVRLKEQLGSTRPKDLLNVLKRADAFRRPGRFAQLLEAACLVNPEFNKQTLEKALDAANGVDAGEIAQRASAPSSISALVDRAREEAIASVL